MCLTAIQHVVTELEGKEDPTDPAEAKAVKMLNALRRANPDFENVEVARYGYINSVKRNHFGPRQLEITFTVQESSIGWYITCQTVEDLQYLRHMYTANSIAVMFREIVNVLLSSTNLSN